MTTYAEIKARHDEDLRVKNLPWTTVRLELLFADRAWLIAECERLRAELEGADIILRGAAADYAKYTALLAAAQERLTLAERLYIRLLCTAPVSDGESAETMAEWRAGR